MLGRAFGPHLCSLGSLSQCSNMMGVLLKYAPAILDAMAGGRREPRQHPALSAQKTVRWRLTALQNMQDDGPSESSEESPYFHFR